MSHNSPEVFLRTGNLDKEVTEKFLLSNVGD